MTCSLLYYTTYRTTGNFSFLTFFKNRTDEGCSFPRNWCNMVNWVGLNRWLTLFMVFLINLKVSKFFSLQENIYIYIRKNKRSLKWIRKFFKSFPFVFLLKLLIYFRVHTRFITKNGFSLKEKRKDYDASNESLVDQQCRLIYWKIIRRGKR